MGSDTNRLSAFRKGGAIMRIFQVILGAVTLIMTFGMFGMSFWIKANFSKGAAVPECYMPISIITTALVVLTVIMIFIGKKAAA